MSTHLLIAAAYLEGLPQTTKLALMAVADSADEYTLLSAPGLPKLRAWTGLGRAQTLAVVAALVDSGHLERQDRGRVGVRASFVVFPQGVPAIPHPSEVAARYTDQGGSGRPDPQLIPQVGDEVGDSPVEAPPGRVQSAGPSGSNLYPGRVRPAGPLHALPTVLSARAPSEASGFPGARPVDRPDPRTAKGAADQPCPLHADQIVPCGRCAHRAAQDRERDPQGPARAAAAARAAIRAATTPAEEAAP